MAPLRYGGGLFGEYITKPTDTQSSQNSTLTFTIERTVISSNAVQFHGGGAYFMRCSVFMHNVAVILNSAESDGGGVYATHSDLVINGTVFGDSLGAGSEEHAAAGNQALGSGGALVLVYGDISVHDSVFRGNSAVMKGGGIYVSAPTMLQEELVGLLHDTSAIDLQEVTIDGNYAAQGAAVAAEVNAVVNISDGSITNNIATLGDGALHLGAGTAVDAHRCVWQGNWAQSGGAIFAETNFSMLRLRECELQGNHAELSGGAVMLERTRTEGAVTFSSLNFTENTAISGPNIIWEWGADMEVPLCANCSSQGDAPPMASTTFTYGILVEGAALEGAVQYASSAIMQPALTYTAKDFYGNIVNLTTITRCYILVSEESQGSLVGTLMTDFVNGIGATFTDVTIKGVPGSAVTVEFSGLSAGSEGEMLVLVELVVCDTGTQYNAAGEGGEEKLKELGRSWAEAGQDVAGVETGREGVTPKVCEACQLNEIKFNNDTTACDECSKDGIECHGGANYSLHNGYWISPGAHNYCFARHPDSGFDATSCILEHVYKCDVEEACTLELERLDTDGTGLLATP
ncbi:hypothetical protein CYMTET_14359 [Cymbomonas tetramitiformis]|uniref:Uncharacterized protein n=1 Tax=Cymbomonas tetramitiformis TaxID=36881 RepID=A0AAE0GGH8_9CHLO|nr:hypothetical protein CYMTET_14359 [Cymbomonas tetramitiformis]